MTSNSFATLTKALGLGKSRKQQSRPPMLRTSHSHSSLFSPNPDLSGSPPSSAPPTHSLRHSKSINNFLTLGRTWTRSGRQQRNHHHHRNQTVDHTISPIFTPFSAPTTPNPATNRPSNFTLERSSTSASSSTASSAQTTYTSYTTTRTANETFPHLSLPAQIWPRFVWDPSADPDDIDLGLEDEDDYDNQPVFADFFHRLRVIEAELDLIEARGGIQN